jgi:phage I-like protein
METDSLFLSLNFEEEKIPERIMLVPAGKTVKGRDSREWKNPDPAQVALNSMSRLPLLPVDENHSTDLSAPKGGASPAFGWLKNLCADTSGAIWADVEWTDRGREALAKKEYRFISPVVMANQKGEINFILRAALTNSPNLNLPALNSEQLENIENKEKKMDLHDELCAVLDLSKTTTDADVIAEVKSLEELHDDLCETLKLSKTAKDSEVLAKVKELVEEEPAKTDLNSTKQKVDLAAYAPRADLNAMETRAVTAEKQLAELNSAQLKKDAETLVDQAITNRKISPASREEYLNLCATQEEIESFKKIVAVSPAIIATEQAPASAPPSGTVSLNSEEAAFAKSAGYTPEEWKKLQEAGK